MSITSILINLSIFVTIYYLLLEKSKGKEFIICSHCSVYLLILVDVRPL